MALDLLLVFFFDFLDGGIELEDEAEDLSLSGLGRLPPAASIRCRLSFLASSFRAALSFWALSISIVSA